MYGLMQGYDAVALEADIQLGGTEQTFNIMCGRTLQERQEQSPQIAVLTPILVGTDGNSAHVQEHRQLHRHRRTAERAVRQSHVDSRRCDRQLLRLRHQCLRTPMSIRLPPTWPVWSTQTDGRQAPSRESSIVKPNGTARRPPRPQRSSGPAPSPRASVPDDIPDAPIDFGGADALQVALPVLLHDIGAAASRAEAKRLVSQGAVRIDDEVVKESERGDSKWRRHPSRPPQVVSHRPVLIICRHEHVQLANHRV